MTRKPKGYYYSQAGPNHCWICGHSLEARHYVRIGKPPPLVREKQEWEQMWKERRQSRKTEKRVFAIDMSASELSRAFRVPGRWNTLFRMILERPGQPYKLSGIGDMVGARVSCLLLVPPDSEMAYIGAPAYKKNKYITVSPMRHPLARWRRKREKEEEENIVKGYAVHSRCWTLLERQLGSERMQHLDLVIAALKEYWKTGRRPNLYSTAMCPCYDPVHIPVVDKMMRTSVKTTGSSIGFAYLSTQFGLPLEIKYMVIEYLDVVSVRNMLWAFNEVLPASYWLAMMPTDLLFEIRDKEDAAPGTVNWASIAVLVIHRKVLEKWQVSLQLKNRQRIFHILQEVERNLTTDTSKT
ncbi:hypothetical protein ASPZODRAFT_145916 [Penicilliopsis zonata CBS 506.65]|uniref:Uncharacterized protein n=1 Tax=Penicilliopsis zonata CBS 506.65 TaxID=1073090 RepID=A0A1L9S8S3_9EURO|nr:hypothetical protein ASPZODRAFT_145916 [Penicilliopsis zonata CBS 506.65]OJJ43561.1 hypothetical protein ASPZODRAFT_145916 [Penicilliopsis zonata CBS 506.65]